MTRVVIFDSLALRSCSRLFTEGAIMSFTPQIILVVLIAGLVCGFLNTVASSGSAVSLPILMAIGLPAAAANATNRIPVLVGAMAATVGLARHGAIPWRRGLMVGAPLTVGAAIGAILSEYLPGHVFAPLGDAANILMFLSDMQAKFAATGFPDNIAPVLGGILVVCTVLYAIARTAVLGAIVLTGFLGGAVVHTSTR
jgi:uncharacterized membrane protein YfcA